MKVSIAESMPIIWRSLSNHLVGNKAFKMYEMLLDQGKSTTGSSCRIAMMMRLATYPSSRIGAIPVDLTPSNMPVLM